MRMGAGTGDRVVWFGAGLGSRPMKEPIASDPRDDGFLVETARSGDREAFGLLY